MRAVWAFVSGVASLAAVAGCTLGSAPLETAAPPPPAPRAADVDPCTLLTEPELAQLGVPGAVGEPEDDPAGRFCGWRSEEQAVGVAVGSGTLEQVENDLDLGAGEAATVAGREGRRIRAGGLCGLLFQVRPDFVLAVIAGSPTAQSDGCVQAEQAAGFALPRVS